MQTYLAVRFYRPTNSVSHNDVQCQLTIFNWLKDPSSAFESDGEASFNTIWVTTIDLAGADIDFNILSARGEPE